MLTPQIVRPLLLEHLRSESKGQIASAAEAVAKAAISKGLLQPRPGQMVVHGASADMLLGRPVFDELYMVVQQLLWQLLPQGVVVWGRDTANDKYPFYRVTPYGIQVVAAVSPQPYDPDGFLKEFARLIPGADAVVNEYLQEAVRSFNSNCHRAAAVLLGCASEKAMLLLHAQFESAISDPQRKSKFEKDSGGISIYRKYEALKDRLDLMVQAKKLPREHVETVGSELPSGFELIRRCRNTAGHPELGGKADQDTVFLNLRSFTEYARRIASLIAYFQANPADW